MTNEHLSPQEVADFELRREFSLHAAEDLAQLILELNSNNIDVSSRTRIFKDVARVLRTEGIPVRPLFERVDGLHKAEWMIEGDVDEFVAPSIKRLRTRYDHRSLYPSDVIRAATSRRSQGTDITEEITWLRQNIPHEKPSDMSVELSADYARFAELLDMNGDDSAGVLQQAEDMLFVGPSRGAWRNRCMVLMRTHIKVGRFHEAQRILDTFEEHLEQVGFVEEFPVNPRVIAFNRMHRSGSQGTDQASDESELKTYTHDWRRDVADLDEYRMREEVDYLSRKSWREMSSAEKIALLQKSVIYGTDSPDMADRFARLATLQGNAGMPEWTSTLDEAHATVTRSFDNNAYTLDGFNDEILHEGLDTLIDIAIQYARAHDFSRAEAVIAQAKGLPFVAATHYTEAMAVVAAEMAKLGLTADEIANLPQDSSSALIHKFLLEESTL